MIVVISLLQHGVLCRELVIPSIKKSRIDEPTIKSEEGTA